MFVMFLQACCTRIAHKLTITGIQFIIALKYGFCKINKATIYIVYIYDYDSPLVK